MYCNVSTHIENISIIQTGNTLFIKFIRGKLLTFQISSRKELSSSSYMIWMKSLPEKLLKQTV